MTDFSDLASLADSITAVASPFRVYLNDLHEKYSPVTEGKTADSPLELASADPAWFGICAAGVDGRIFEVGECDRPFTIQAISKAILFGLALEEHGREFIASKVNVEPIGEAPNAIVLDERTRRPHNPIVNAGAIAITDLIRGETATDRLNKILDTFKRYTGRDHEVNVPVFLSMKAAGARDRAVAHLMVNFGIVGDKIEETLDLYFQQGAIVVTARDLALIAATLANGGINPLTRKRAIEERYARDVICVLLTCGLHDASGEWAYRVGLPAKTGISGGLMALAPGKLGIGTFSPLLDARGNSVRGTRVCEEISRDFGLHLFDFARPDRDLRAWLAGEEESLDGW